MADDIGRRETRSALSRRELLKGLAAGAGAGMVARPAGALDALLPGRLLRADAPLPPSPASAALRCYVLVVDGLHASELTSALMPGLSSLRRAGVWYPKAKAVAIAETLPNHAAMMTGVRGARNGVPANVAYVAGERRVRFLEEPADLRAPTLFDVLRARGVSTGAVLSKRYLHTLFGTRPDRSWRPEPLIPESDHAPDVFTVQALLDLVVEHDPRFVFANFGDVDRMGHADVTGMGPAPVARSAALAGTDRQIARFVEYLKASGRWRHSVVIVLADHSMDWSVPHQVVTVRETFDADPLLRGRYEVAENGGAGLLYWLGDPAARDRAVARMAQLGAAIPGVDRLVASSRLELGERGGDLVLLVKQGWRFSDPGVDHNKIPGTHGHTPTLPIPFLITGGARSLYSGVSRDVEVRTLDVAPTVAWLFGVPLGPLRYQGRPRLEAFDTRAPRA